MEEPCSRKREEASGSWCLGPGAGAETVETGPDVIGTTAGEEPTITEAWAGRGAEGPSEEEGSFATERPKLEEDAGSSSL